MSGAPADSRGFSLLEVVIVMAIAGILAAVAIGGMGGLQARMGVRAAQSEFLSMHAQTRATAVERGIPVALVTSPDGDVRIQEGCDGTGAALQSRDFGEQHGVTVETGDGEVVLCMTPRGYASQAGNSFSGEARIGFVRGDHSRAVILRPLGQAVRP